MFSYELCEILYFSPFCLEGLAVLLSAFFVDIMLAEEKAFFKKIIVNLFISRLCLRSCPNRRNQQSCHLNGIFSFATRSAVIPEYKGFLFFYSLLAFIFKF